MESGFCPLRAFSAESRGLGFDPVKGTGAASFVGGVSCPCVVRFGCTFVVSRGLSGGTVAGRAPPVVGPAVMGFVAAGFGTITVGVAAAGFVAGALGRLLTPVEPGPAAGVADAGAGGVGVPVTMPPDG